MKLFSLMLFCMLLVLAGYTGVVIGAHGLNLLPVFFGDIAKMEWPGQFNLDFLTLLTLSASWTVWRNAFTAKAWGLAVLAFFLGGAFLMTYLLWLYRKHGGNWNIILMGEHHAKG
jgi:hypothetical protein